MHLMTQMIVLLPYSCQQLSSDDFPEEKREDYQKLFRAVLCMTSVHKFSLDLGLLFACFCHLVPVLFALIVLGLVG